MAEPYIGQINMFGGNFAPRGYAFCDGQLITITQHTALFTILGTTYGGDGRTTFGLPNLQGRAPMHWGSGPGLTPRRIGQTGGSTTVALNEAEIPPHSHGMKAGVASTSNVPSAMGALGNANVYAGTSDPPAPMSAQAIGATGNGAAHENRQPYLAIDFIIALQGIYPSRD